MKSFKNYNILTGIVVTLLVTSIAIGQGNEPPGNKVIVTDNQKSAVTSMIEDNIVCFKSIECLKTHLGSHIKFEGNTSPATDHYTIRAEARNEHFYAEYDKNGSLVYCEHKMIDVRLPVEIYQSLASSDYKGWMVIGSERKVLNFNPDTTEFMVILQHGDKGKVLYFDRFGKQKATSTNV